MTHVTVHEGLVNEQEINIVVLGQLLLGVCYDSVT